MIVCFDLFVFRNDYFDWKNVLENRRMKMKHFEDNYFYSMEILVGINIGKKSFLKIKSISKRVFFSVTDDHKFNSTANLNVPTSKDYGRFTLSTTGKHLSSSLTSPREPNLYPGRYQSTSKIIQKSLFDCLLLIHRYRKSFPSISFTKTIDKNL